VSRPLLDLVRGFHEIEVATASACESGTRRNLRPQAMNTAATTANTNTLAAASVQSSPCIPNLRKPKPSSLIMQRIGIVVIPLSTSRDHP